MTTNRLERPRQGAGLHVSRTERLKNKDTWTYLGALALIALLVLLRQSWAIQVLLVPALLTVPGVILLRALRIPAQAVSSFPVYVPCASLIVLLASGLAVDLIGPLVGLAQPLRAGPLLVGFELACLALLASSRHAPPNVAIPWRSLERFIRDAWPLVLPLLAAAGALRLNNGHGNGLAVVALCACILTLLWAFAGASRLNEILLAVILYSVALAMLCSFTLRGDLVDGFDIATEYHILQQTVLTGVWHTSHPGDAYGAMLSVTVLPAEVHALSGVPALLVINLVYPVIYALFPMAIFNLARRLVSRRWAFLASVFVLGQYYFAEIAGFARTEIAFVIFVALIAALLDNHMRRHSQWVFVALLGIALAISHYSTTYVTITILGLSLALQWIASWFRDVPRISGAVAVGFVACLTGAFVWYGPVTHSPSNLAQFVHSMKTQGLDVLPNRVHGEGLLSAYLHGNVKAPIQARQYATLVHAEYSATVPYVTPMADAGSAQYALQDQAPPTAAVRWPLGYNALSLGDLMIIQFAYLPAGIGAVALALRRRVPVIARQFGLLTLATLILLAVVRFSGTIAVAYGQERALVQGMAFFAITMSWSMQGLAGQRGRRETAVIAVTTASLAVILIVSSYLMGALIGGEPSSSVSLANSGENYEMYYMTQPELASARWLGEFYKPKQLVYADEYAQLPLIAMIGVPNGLTLDITPLTLNRHAWVYASRTNVVDEQAFSLFKYHLASYRFPSSFLDANFDVVYTDGSSEVYYR